MTAKMSEKDSKESIQKAFQLFKGPTGKISFDDLRAVAKELGETMSDEELLEMTSVYSPCGLPQRGIALQCNGGHSA